MDTGFRFPRITDLSPATLPLEYPTLTAVVAARQAASPTGRLALRLTPCGEGRGALIAGFVHAAARIGPHGLAQLGSFHAEVARRVRGAGALWPPHGACADRPMPTVNAPFTLALQSSLNTFGVDSGASTPQPKRTSTPA